MISEQFYSLWVVKTSSGSRLASTICDVFSCVEGRRQYDPSFVGVQSFREVQWNGKPPYRDHYIENLHIQYEELSSREWSTVADYIQDGPGGLCHQNENSTSYID